LLFLPENGCMFGPKQEEKPMANPHHCLLPMWCTHSLYPILWAFVLLVHCIINSTHGIYPPFQSYSCYSTKRKTNHLYHCYCLGLRLAFPLSWPFWNIPFTFIRQRHGVPVCCKPVIIGFSTRSWRNHHHRHSWTNNKTRIWNKIEASRKEGQHKNMIQEKSTSFCCQFLHNDKNMSSRCVIFSYWFDSSWQCNVQWRKRIHALLLNMMRSILCHGTSLICVLWKRPKWKGCDAESIGMQAMNDSRDG